MLLRVWLASCTMEDCRVKQQPPKLCGPDWTNCSTRACQDTLMLSWHSSCGTQLLAKHNQLVDEAAFDAVWRYSALVGATVFPCGVHSWPLNNKDKRTFTDACEAAVKSGGSCSAKASASCEAAMKEWRELLCKGVCCLRGRSEGWRELLCKETRRCRDGACTASECREVLRRKSLA